VCCQRISPPSLFLCVSTAKKHATILVLCGFVHVQKKHVTLKVENVYLDAFIEVVRQARFDLRPSGGSHKLAAHST
jgi:F0F1-type ATP synthase epsilon subunit